MILQQKRKEPNIGIEQHLQTLTLSNPDGMSEYYGERFPVKWSLQFIENPQDVKLLMKHQFCLLPMKVNVLKKVL